MHHFRNVLLSLVAIVVAAFAAAAQRPFRFATYGVDEGLPQSSVWSLLQDKEGYLWIGTADGLCRYDGLAFNRILPEAGAPSIKGMVHLYEDRRGDIWITYQQGVMRYHPPTGKLREEYHLLYASGSECFHKILGEDRVGNIWVALMHQGLLCIAPSGGVVRGPVAVSTTDSPSDPIIFDGFIDRQDRIWGLDERTGLFCYDTKTGKTRQALAGSGGYALLPLSDTLLLTAFRDTLIYLNTLTFQSRRVPAFQCWSKEPPPFVLDITPDREGLLWLCTPQGAYVYDNRTHRIIRQFAAFGENTSGLKGYGYAYTALRDRSGNLWIGTNGDGLKKLPAAPLFLHYVHPTSGGSLVKSLCLQDSLIYAGMYDNGLQIFHQRTGFLRSIPQQALHGTATGSTVYAIAPFDATHLFLYSNQDAQMDVGLLQTHTLHYQSLGAQLRKELPLAAGAAVNYPFALTTRRGEVLFNKSGRLMCLRRAGQEDLHFEDVHSFGRNRITCAFRDSRGRLFVGSLSGFYRSEGRQWRYQPMSSGAYVKTFAEDGNGNLWVGTTTGLGIFNAEGKSLAWITEHNGLKNDFIYGILRDGQGRMWASHNRGLSMYDPATQAVRHWSKEDGLQSNEFNTGAYAKGPAGELLFGGINGITAFIPDSITPNPVPPQARITRITLFDQPLRSDTAHDHITHLRLPYDQNSLGFEVAALEFTDPARNAIAYIMEGLDKNWVYAGTKRHSIRYPALQPGSYVLKVRAANSDGVWSQTPRTLYITILPPFWKTFWFQALAGLAGVGLVIGVLAQWQKQRYRRRLRTLELQRRLQAERERISRDLHDNVGTQLSLICAHLSGLSEQPHSLPAAEQAQKLEHISCVAQEMITTLRDTIWTLNRERLTLEELNDKLKAFTGKMLAGKDTQVALRFSESGSAAAVALGPSEALHLYRICQEAVANALKYAGADLLRVHIQTGNENNYTITIADNGRGFEITTAGTGYGLDNMRHRAAEIGCRLHVVSRPGEGTTVCIQKGAQ